MKRTAVVRHVTLGALAAGLVPLASAGAGAAPSGGSPAALCYANVGDRGPGGGPVVGEGPSGDPMSVTIGWEPSDWPDGLREVVTCVSVDGRAAPGLTAPTATPPNAGSLTLRLTLPPGEPGSLVCQQSVLVGTGSTEGRTRPTSPVCFKLRAAEPPPPTRAGGRTSEGAPGPAPARPPAPNPGPPADPPAPNPRIPAGPPALSPKTPAPPPAPRPAPTPAPSSPSAAPPSCSANPIAGPGRPGAPEPGSVRREHDRRVGPVGEEAGHAAAVGRHGVGVGLHAVEDGAVVEPLGLVVDVAGLGQRVVDQRVERQDADPPLHAPEPAAPRHPGLEGDPGAVG